MLLRSLFLVLFVAVLADAIVNAGAAAARAAYHRREMTALREGLASAVALAQQAAAGEVSPHPLSTCAYASNGGCTLRVDSDAAPSTAALPAATACPVASCTVLMQNNSAVSEGRSTFTISARVLAPNGDTLASRNATVAFRTFAQPPYATLVGSLDATLDAALTSGAGDDGGNVAGTLIHVRYSGPAGDVPGDVWRPVEQRPAGNAQPWNP